MNISDELSILINSALVDGKITRAEKKVLINKAKNDGLNEDEFILYLDGLLQKKKSGNVSFWILGVLVIIGVGIVALVLYNKSKDDEILAKYGCADFNDCLSQYKFDGAYYYYNQEKTEFETSGNELTNLISGKGEEIFNKYRKLITAQVAYWNQNKKYENSINILQEYSFSNSYVLTTDDEDDNKGYNAEVSFYNNILGDVIGKMIIDDVNKDDLLKYANLYKPIVIGNEKDKGLFGGYNSFVLNEEPYEKALVKINELKQ